MQRQKFRQTAALEGITKFIELLDVSENSFENPIAHVRH